MNKFLENNTGSLVLAGVGIFLLYKIKTGTLSELAGIKGAEQQKANIDSIFNQIAKSASVKPELNSTHMAKAEALYKAMNHMGTDEDSVYNILKTITGPNQMKAVYYYYNIRTLYVLGVPFNEGDLFYHLLIELGRDSYDKKIAAPFENWVGVKY